MKVIKIGAVWCPGCLVMRPRWQEIEAEHPWLATEYHDFDQDREFVRGLSVEGDKLPVFIFMDSDGREMLRLNGEVTKKRLVEIIMENKDK